MKKVILILSAVILLSACQKTAETETYDIPEPTFSVAGRTYVKTSVKNDSKPVEFKEQKLIFNEDDTFVLTGYRDEDKTINDLTGTYSVKDDTVTISYKLSNEHVTYDDPGMKEYEDDAVMDVSDDFTIEGDRLVFIEGIGETVYTLEE